MLTSEVYWKIRWAFSSNALPRLRTYRNKSECDVVFLSILRKYFICLFINNLDPLLLSEWMQLIQHQLYFSISEKSSPKKVTSHKVTANFSSFIFNRPFRKQFIRDVFFFHSGSQGVSCLFLFTFLYFILFLKWKNWLQINVDCSMSRTSYRSQHKHQTGASFSATNAHTFSSWPFELVLLCLNIWFYLNYLVFGFHFYYGRYYVMRLWLDIRGSHTIFGNS